MSKVLERIVAKRLDEFSNNHPHSEVMQSSYKRGHSTETALLKIQNDVLHAIDNKLCVILVLLDLSAAFDTVDHDILLNRPKLRFGIIDTAHKWFISYLAGRQQSVLINDIKSNQVELNCNVPQGSVLGPKLFIDYESPLGDIVRKHGLQVHFYADDSQIYFSFDPKFYDDAIARVEKCILEVREWMAKNMLKLNNDKTEYILLGTPQHIPVLFYSSLFF